MKKTLLTLLVLLISASFSFAQTLISFEDGKVKLSEFDGYADDAVVTINLIVTNEGGWGPGWGIGRITDYAFAKDGTPFASSITVKASSAEGSLNSYQYTVAELKAMASISPDNLEELIEASGKEFGEDWTVDEDDYIVDAWGDIGFAVNVWGTGTLTSITIQKAPPTFVLDFESDELETAYPVISLNAPDQITATVENRPGGGGKALHVINANWDTYPQFFIAFPKGSTLADVESISFELYFESVESVGGQQPNSYKEFRYFFGPEGSTFTAAGKGTGNLVGNPSDNPGKTWLKKSFVPNIDDESLRPLNKFEFGFGLHINNAGNYFLDNIRFILKEGEAGIINIEKPKIKIYNTEDGIIVTANNEKVSIYGIDGRVIKQTVADNNTHIALPRGLYIVKVGVSNAAKVLVR